MLKEPLQLFYVYFWKDIEPSVRHKATIGDKAVKMRVEVDEIAKGLDRDHDPRRGFFLIQGLTEKLFQAIVGAAAEFSQKLSIEPEMGPKHLGDSKDILPVR